MENVEYKIATEFETLYWVYEKEPWEEFDGISVISGIVYYLKMKNRDDKFKIWGL